MSHAHWTLDDINWHAFDASKVNSDIAALIRTAALVEYGGNDYADYLSHVFHDDAAFQAVVRQWALEEVQHGKALAKWATLVDPTFNFEQKFAEFQRGFKVDVNAGASVRGSRSGELVARCLVETGTSSYYTALAEATDEPVLKQICRNIAADELRHYKLFYTSLNERMGTDKLSRWQRLKVALGRIAETEDDELSYAYYAANENGTPYNRQQMSASYLRRATAYYQPHHLARAVGMIFKACGFNPQSRLRPLFDKVAWWALLRQRAKLQGAA